MTSTFRPESGRKKFLSPPVVDLTEPAPPSAGVRKKYLKAPLPTAPFVVQTSLANADGAPFYGRLRPLPIPPVVRGTASAARFPRLKLPSDFKPPSVSGELHKKLLTRLTEATDAVLSGGKLQISLQTLYKNAETLCSQGASDTLWSMLTGKLKAHVTTQLCAEYSAELERLGVHPEPETPSETFASLSDKAVFDILAALSRIWQNWTAKITLLRRIYSPLTLVRPAMRHSRHNNGPVYEEACTLFHTHLLLFQNCATLIPACLLRISDQYRAATIISRLSQAGSAALAEAEVHPAVSVSPEEISDVLSTFTVISRHTSFFSMTPEAVENATQHFGQIGSALRPHVSIAQFIIVGKALMDSQMLLSSVIAPESLQRLSPYTLTHKHFFEPFCKPVLSAGLIPLIQSEDSWTMASMDVLFRGSLTIQYSFSGLWQRKVAQHVRECCGNTEMSSAELFRQLKKFHAQCELFRNRISDLTPFGPDIAEAFATGFSGTRAAEAICRGADEAIRHVYAGKSDFPALQDTLKYIVALRAMMPDKGTFDTLWKSLMSKRLLLHRSDVPLERRVAQELRERLESGVTLANELLAMLEDVTTSEQLTEQFAGLPSSADFPPTEVTVLNQATWPNLPRPSCWTARGPLFAPLAAYKDFYTEKHKGRNLSYLPTLSTCTVTAQFQGKPRELEVTWFQLHILEKFSERDEWVYAELEAEAATAGVTPRDVARAVFSLACGKYKVLVKTPKDREFLKRDDRFRYNEELRAKSGVMRVPTISPKNISEFAGSPVGAES